MDIRHLKCGAGTGSERAIMGTSLKKVAKKTKEYKYVLLAMRHALSHLQKDGTTKRPTYS